MGMGQTFTPYCADSGLDGLGRERIACTSLQRGSFSALTSWTNERSVVTSDALPGRDRGRQWYQ